MTDDEIIALAHKYIEFDQGKLDWAALNAELAKCRDTGELIAVGTAYKMLKGKGLVINSNTPDNPLCDRSKQIAHRLTGGVKENVGIEQALKSWGDLRGMPRDISGDLAASPSQVVRDFEMTRQVYKRTVYVGVIPHVITVTQKARTVWEAVGDYRGEPIRVKGSSADVAMKDWADAALKTETIDARPSGSAASISCAEWGEGRSPWIRVALPQVLEASEVQSARS